MFETAFGEATAKIVFNCWYLCHALLYYPYVCCVCLFDEWIRAINQQLRLDENGMDTTPCACHELTLWLRGRPMVSNVWRTRSTQFVYNDLIDFETIELRALIAFAATKNGSLAFLLMNCMNISLEFLLEHFGLLGIEKFVFVFDCEQINGNRLGFD